uniref:Uncharacterized protein n=1 Tax=Anguilla anguilla TaxID=7936 RepID=A0A0E9Q0G7_ANGAN
MAPSQKKQCPVLLTLASLFFTTPLYFHIVENITLQC